jgi:hypothetical protein
LKGILSDLFGHLRTCVGGIDGEKRKREKNREREHEEQTDGHLQGKNECEKKQNDGDKSTKIRKRKVSEQGNLDNKHTQANERT